jgi:hypothetical protein
MRSAEVVTRLATRKPGGQQIMKSHGIPFQPGNRFGRGRPKGSRNKSSLTAQGIFAQHADSIVRKCIADAMRGNPRAMDLCMARVAAPQKERMVKLKIPSITKISGIPDALSTILQAVADGKLTPADALKLAEIMENRCRIMATVEHENRLQALESKSLRTNRDGKLKGE